METRTDLHGAFRETAHQRLRPASSVALVVAGIIGAGLFTTTGFLLDLLGSPLLVLAVWVAGGLLALCGATIYGELGAMMPHSGGEYVYLSRAFRPSMGFLSGWVSLVVGFSAPVALAAFALGTYIEAAAPLFPAKMTGTLLIICLTASHLSGITWGGRFNAVLTGAKVLLLLVFITIALAYGQGDWSNVTAGVAVTSPGALAISLILVSYSYSGWNIAGYIAGELWQPRKTLPWVLVVGTAIAVGLTIAVNIVFLFAAPPERLADAGEQVGVVAAYALFGAPGRSAILVLVGLALVSSASAMIMAGPRIYAAMAKDDMFFRALAKRNSRGTPWVSIIFQSAVAEVMLITSTFLDLLTYVGFTLSLFSMLSVAAVFVLRRRAPDAARPYRALGWPYSGFVFLGLSGLMISYSLVNRPIIAMIGILTLLSGVILFYLWSGVSKRLNTHIPGKRRWWPN